MPFDQNLFISYAHIDDQPLTPGQQGWITRFHATLAALLSMRIGRPAKIWRDEKLRGNDVFSDEIIAQFDRTAVLVSILTSRYVASEWCTREAREFCERACRAGGLTVGNKSRIFKVIKTPVDTEDPLPPPMKDLLGYEFFTLKEGTPLELDSAYGQEYAQLYNQQVARLAWDVAQLLKHLEGAEPAAGSGVASASATKPTVFLAECSYDRKQARDALSGELKRLGYPVVPDTRLPSGEAEYVDAVDALLAGSALSIHLVGEHSGAVPDGPSMKSVTVLQNERAIARARSASLPRLIWVPEGTRSAHDVHQAFIDALHQDAATQFGADLITGDLEQLRAAVHATLKTIEQPPPATTGAAESDRQEPVGAQLIYLLCDERDRKATIPVRKAFREEGFDVALPAFEGNASQVRQANQQLLASCDGVLVFYGEGDEAWKRTIDNELKKMAGYRGGNPLPPRYTYLATPKTRDKEDLIEMQEPNLIDGLAGLDRASLAGFTAAIRSGDRS